MKNLLLSFALFTTSLLFSQAYTGAGDIKFQVGANIQSGGTGIASSVDFGLGENISLGVYSSYLLNVQGSLGAQFEDRFDVQGRFNANIGNVITSDRALDVYPGLHVGTRNFGGHLGIRYFFSNGFGLYSELHIPFAYYKDNLSSVEELNNQVTVTVGTSFNI